MAVPTVADIDLGVLTQQGIRGILLDLDNTLVPWNGWEVSAATAQWVKEARRRGFRLAILSNSVGRRAHAVARRLGIFALSTAWKPLPSGFRKALAQLGTGPAETAVVGDQLFTDVAGGNAAGLFTIWVQPLSPREMPHTRFLRWAERRLSQEWGLDVQ